MSEPPSLEEIERAYVRRRPEQGPMTRAYGRFVRVWTAWGVWLFEIVCGLAALYTLSDLLLDLSGESRWGDFFGLLGMMLFGLVVGGLCHIWFAFIGFGRPERER